MKPFIILRIAHWAMATTLILALGIIVLIYGFDVGLSIPVLIFFHIFFVLLATIFKISYVARLAALKQLGKPAH